VVILPKLVGIRIGSANFLPKRFGVLGKKNRLIPKAELEGVN